MSARLFVIRARGYTRLARLRSAWFLAVSHAA